MKISIQTILLDSHELFLLFDHQHRPVIEIKETQYHALGSLLKAYPQLQREKHLEKLAQTANFLAQGLEFQCIEDIESFKISYYQQTVVSSLIKDYGIFDLSVMHPPRSKDRQLIFFVKHDYLGLPYRVTLNYPNGEDVDPEMHYELLPLKKKIN